MIQLNQKRLAKVQDDLADKNAKLATARGQLAELTSEIEFKDANLKDLKEKFMEVAGDYKTQVRNTLIESVFANVTTAFNELLDSLPSDQRQAFSQRFPLVTGIVERAPNVINCAMLLFIENINGAIQFAQSAGGGSSDNDLKWGRDPDEDDRKFAFRCMQQAHRLLKPAPSRTVRSGR